jgi:hypothetical protein
MYSKLSARSITMMSWLNWAALSHEERLLFHQQHSARVMDERNEPPPNLHNSIWDFGLREGWPDGQPCSIGFLGFCGYTSTENRPRRNLTQGIRQRQVIQRTLASWHVFVR